MRFPWLLRIANLSKTIGRYIRQTLVVIKSQLFLSKYIIRCLTLKSVLMMTIVC